MNHVDFNREVAKLANWLDGHATPYALAYLLAQKQLVPALLNGQNTVTMREAGLELKRDLRLANGISAARADHRRKRRAKDRAEEELRAALTGRARRKGIAT